MRKRFPVQFYIDGILAGDRVVLSQAITLTESRLPADRLIADELLEKILPHTGRSFRIGITGAPGVGKSTFIEAFGHHLTSVGKTVAVLAIDPSSPRSGGSILGDKTRMDRLSNDPRAFVRPSANGSSPGGVTRHTRETMLLCEAAGFEIMIIETVGVGQSETMVKEMTDFFLLLVIPGAGDYLQGIKKGVMEMVDAVVINKADGKNEKAATSALSEYRNALHVLTPPASGFPVEVLLCSALENKNLPEIHHLMERYEAAAKASGFFEENRRLQNLDWLNAYVWALLEDRFFADTKIRRQLAQMESAVRGGEIHPAMAARKLIDLFLKK